MKALSLWQPWASLWISGRKIHETRHWYLQVPSAGFWLAVHAAKKLETDLDPELRAIVDDQFGSHWAMDMPRGAIIGRVHVTRCRKTENVYVIEERELEAQDDFTCGNFGPRRYAFETDGRRALITPIPYRGLQSIFSVPDWPEHLERAA